MAALTFSITVFITLLFLNHSTKEFHLSLNHWTLSVAFSKASEALLTGVTVPSTSSEKSFTLDEVIEAKKSLILLISHLIPSIAFETALDKNPKMLVTTSELVIRLFTKVIISDK